MKIQNTPFYVYMLQCVDQSLYTGYTVNLRRRLDQHRCGKGSAYVRSRMPFQLVYQEIFQTRQAAMQREAEIKQWSRKRKLVLLESVKRSGSMRTAC